VIGGAVGNLIDRVRYGSVVDFIHVYWRRYQWPDFNVADSAISVGVILLVLESLFSRGGEEGRPRPAGPG
jgi:signal peptidase II